MGREIRRHPAPSAAPYEKKSSSSSTAVTTAATPAPTGSKVPTFTLYNMHEFNFRAKKLPPDANTKAATHAKFIQLRSPVLFSCAKCRRDRIQADSLAVDRYNKIILCSACLARVVRPKTYKPTRYVPFPSLLSWLNYKPSPVMNFSTTEDSREDILSRPAEAVAPSGDRVHIPLLGEGRNATKLENLPVTPMNIIPSGEAAEGPSSVLVYAKPTMQKGGTHPCVRVWGACQHGPDCYFSEAPQDLCLAYLMGLCRTEGCPLLHQQVYDLPREESLPATTRRKGDLDFLKEEDDEGSTHREKNSNNVWLRWVMKRKNSPNMAEWQLFNNGDLTVLFEQYVPLEEVPEEEGKTEEENTQVKLNLSDIRAALSGL
ncbi:hypothetical protein AGDE_02978 [Angomonas deanei]|uniref:C3H1-type domain-containing protein n=1 Tax=Angomonas deanei TaxID=59799 RepID=A0A7G2C7G9_9TRYP|nr:hypothetical protein AGDE_02978 [Angomonas deanei]CAD2215696.1 hypothetical protein, conserved [Angomonas deanei]|eukprot:EPY40947.1 hypothetical protein AGDE_02978 [Angomonas deanei]